MHIDDSDDLEFSGCSELLAMTEALFLGGLQGQDSSRHPKPLLSYTYLFLEKYLHLRASDNRRARHVDAGNCILHCRFAFFTVR